MVRHGVLRFIFSSTAAVYGDPRYVPVDEQHPREPINPYGLSKRMVEDALFDYARAHGLHSVLLRYFNAAGADPQARLGPRHNPLTHLIPLVLRAAAGVTPNVKVFGRDYPTPDGTAIRDYIHIEDLADAHVRALDVLEAGAHQTLAVNLGTGVGSSVREVIDATAAIAGRSVPYEEAPRRPGDPVATYADPAYAEQVLGWRAQRRLGEIVESAYRWHSSTVGV